MVGRRTNRRTGGKLIVDATCAPADIRHPTDLSLLNEARETTEQVIDTLCKAHGVPKPRTDRKKARKQYLAIARRKKVTVARRRKGVRQQITHLERNFRNIDRIVEQFGLRALSWRLYHRMLVVREVLRQQKEMLAHRTNRVANRIVNIAHPHVRPIVRGKARNKTEFGAKLSASLVDGYAFVDRIHWENASEGGDLEAQIEGYHKRFECYPESVHVDKAYRNRKNLQFCKKNGIRLSGPKLGKPFKDTEANQEKIRELKQLTRQDELDRIPIEGKFGEDKRRYGLDRIMAKLAGTSEMVIQMCFLVMNLRKWLRAILLRLPFGRGWLSCLQQILSSAIEKVLDGFFNNLLLRSSSASPC